MGRVPVRCRVWGKPVAQFVFRGPWGLVSVSRVPWWWGSWVWARGVRCSVVRWWWLGFVVVGLVGLGCVVVRFGWVGVFFVVWGLLRSR